MSKPTFQELNAQLDLVISSQVHIAVMKEKAGGRSDHGFILQRAQDSANNDLRRMRKMLEEVSR